MTDKCPGGCSRDADLATLREGIRELTSWKKSVTKLAIGNLATVISFIVTVAWGAATISTKVDQIREDLAKYELRVRENTDELKRIDRELTRHVVKSETIFAEIARTAVR